VVGRGEPASDGRTARRDRNRELVLDTVLELFSEGRVAPSAAEVAERAGVSLRSVFRYFDDTEALARAAMARHHERIEPLLDLPHPGEGPLADRVDVLTRQRLRLYRTVAPVARVAVVRASTDRQIAAQLASMRAQLRDQAAAMFAPELEPLPVAERRAALDAVDALLQFESVEHLRRRLGRSEARTAEVLGRALRALLAS